MANLPKLTPGQMAAVMAELKRLPLDASTKERIALMLTEAANDDRHNVDRLDAGRAADRKAAAAAVTDHFRGIMGRAVAGLAAISDAEWNAMVEEAGREQD